MASIEATLNLINKQGSKLGYQEIHHHLEVQQNVIHELRERINELEETKHLLSIQDESMADTTINELEIEIDHRKHIEDRLWDLRDSVDARRSKIKRGAIFS